MPDMDMSQYRELFLSEAREHLQAMNGLIPDLEENPSDKEKINSLFRSAHSLKGMAASMGYDPLAELAHRMEDLMTRVRGDELTYGKGIASLLLEAADVLALLLDDVAMDRPLAVDIEAITGRLAGFTPSAALTTPPPIVVALPETPEKPAQPPAEAHHEVIHTVRVRTEILDRLIDTTGELFTTRHRLQNISHGLTEPRLNETLHDLERLLRELHQTVMQARLIPFSSVADRFPRMIRDIARKCGKEVSFHVHGKEIELDRRVLEELTDPLQHILRNAVDHGIEAPGLRTVAGKNPSGKVTLSVRREKDQAVIAVEDDGRGMDPVALIRAAVSKGLISAEKGSQLAPGDALMLTCLPGFSTSSEVTDVSGRGVGMDAVRAAVQTLGGSITIDSVVGRGSTMTLRLPLSIAIINVLLISAGSFRVALPASAVIRTLEITREQVVLRDRQPYILVDDTEIPLKSLNRIMGLPVKDHHSGYVPVLVMMLKGQLSGLLADRVIGQREMHVKPLGRPLNRMRGLAGGGILGDGEVVFVLDPATML